MRKSEKGNPLDLRVWLDEVRKFGELRDVVGADWKLELGAISEMNVSEPLMTNANANTSSGCAAMWNTNRLPVDST